MATDQYQNKNFLRQSKKQVYKSKIKRYLYKHVDSRFLEIPAEEWDIAALIPYEYFIGATKNKVYADSRKKF